eukprot:gene10194-8106_t
MPPEKVSAISKRKGRRGFGVSWSICFCQMGEELVGSSELAPQAAAGAMNQLHSGTAINGTPAFACECGRFRFNFCSQPLSPSPALHTRRPCRSFGDGPVSEETKSRWKTPDLPCTCATAAAPIVSQKIQLLTAGKEIDDRPTDHRSPSPEPTYNEQGVRTNTREQRQKDKLMKERQDIIAELIKSNPVFKPPSDYRPEKKTRRIPIPVHEFPLINFIGLVIGPRGNTQKRMEKESGAKIVIRGKGSMKEGRAKPLTASGKPVDNGENEELHVLVTAENDEQLIKACDMIEALMSPEEMDHNKRLQLRELAELNGTLQEQQGMVPRDEGDVYQLPSHLKERADEQYRRDLVSLHPEESGRLENELSNFMLDLGGSIPGYKSSSSHVRGRNEDDNRRDDERMGGERQRGEDAEHRRPGLGIRRGGDRDSRDEEDTRNLYVGYISQHVNESELAATFGQASDGAQVLECRIIQDRHSGASRGFGFIRMETEEAAILAVERLNQYMLHGKRLAVRYKGKQPPPEAQQKIKDRLQAEHAAAHPPQAPAAPSGGYGALPPPPPPPHGVDPYVQGYYDPAYYAAMAGMPPGGYPGWPSGGADAGADADPDEAPPGTVDTDIEFCVAPLPAPAGAAATPAPDSTGGVPAEAGRPPAGFPLPPPRMVDVVRVAISVEGEGEDGDADAPGCEPECRVTLSVASVPDPSISTPAAGSEEAAQQLQQQQYHEYYAAYYGGHGGYYPPGTSQPERTDAANARYPGYGGGYPQGLEATYYMTSQEYEAFNTGGPGAAEAMTAAQGRMAAATQQLPGPPPVPGADTDSPAVVKKAPAAPAKQRVVQVVSLDDQAEHMSKVRRHQEEQQRLQREREERLKQAEMRGKAAAAAEALQRHIDHTGAKPEDGEEVPGMESTKRSVSPPPPPPPPPPHMLTGKHHPAPGLDRFEPFKSQRPQRHGRMKMMRIIPSETVLPPSGPHPKDIVRPPSPPPRRKVSPPRPPPTGLEKGVGEEHLPGAAPHRLLEGEEVSTAVPLAAVGAGPLLPGGGPDLRHTEAAAPPPEGAVGGGRRTAVAAALRHGDTAVALHPMGGTTAGIPRVEGNLGAEEVEGGVVEEVPETEAGPRRRSACYAYEGPGYGIGDGRQPYPPFSGGLFGRGGPRMPGFPMGGQGGFPGMGMGCHAPWGGAQVFFNGVDWVGGGMGEGGFYPYNEGAFPMAEEWDEEGYEEEEAGAWGEEEGALQEGELPESEAGKPEAGEAGTTELAAEEGSAQEGEAGAGQDAVAATASATVLPTSADAAVTPASEAAAGGGSGEAAAAAPATALKAPASKPAAAPAASKPAEHCWYCVLSILLFPRHRVALRSSYTPKAEEEAGGRRLCTAIGSRKTAIPDLIAMQKIAIDVVSDTVCPWCFVGKRRLEAAMAKFPDVEFQVRWFPFQLNAAAPVEGENKMEMWVQ